MHNSVPVVSRAAERAEFCVEVLVPGLVIAVEQGMA
jgi:hypothetical protein